MDSPPESAGNDERVVMTHSPDPTEKCRASLGQTDPYFDSDLAGSFFPGVPPRGSSVGLGAVNEPYQRPLPGILGELE